MSDYIYFEGRIEPMEWGKNVYTIQRIPTHVMADLPQGTRRIEGEFGDHPVNLALTKAPVIEGSFVYTGKTHLFNVSQRTLLNDLFKNFLMAFLIITPMLVLALRSLALGLIAMIPNVFPAAVVQFFAANAADWFADSADWIPVPAFAVVGFPRQERISTS